MPGAHEPVPEEPERTPFSGDDAALDAAIAKAHEARDPVALANLYSEGARRMEEKARPEDAFFLTTQAMVYAFEAGLPLAESLKAKLVAAKRDA